MAFERVPSLFCERYIVCCVKGEKQRGGVKMKYLCNEFVKKCQNLEKVQKKLGS